MAKITASMVKELRQRSGAGMMDCKKALVETEGNMEEAIVYLQKKGIAKAGKKAGRTAAEGLVGYHVSEDAKEAVIVEINCETDFVARNDQFQNLVKQVVEVAFTSGAKTIEELKAATIEDGKSVDAWIPEQIAKIGENVQVRRMERVSQPEGIIGAYVHAGSQIGTLVSVRTSSASDEAALEFARDIAMHVAAANPQYLNPSDIDAAETAKQKDIFMAQAGDMGKPPEIVEKIIQGRLRKWQGEISLTKQPYVKEPDMTVEKYQKKVGGVELAGYTRFQVGEGIEVEKADLAAEVAAQLGK
jgi:elongation factor Ts